MISTIVPMEWAKAVFALAVVSPRMLVALVVLPFFANKIMTRIMTAGVSSVLIIPIVPAVIVQLPEHIETPWLFAILLKESVVGLIIGFVCAIPFWAAQAMGFLIDNQRGASSAQMSDPTTSEMTTPLGVLFAQMFNILFLMAGGLGLFLTMMYNSYLVWPVFGWMPTFDAAFPAYFLGLLDLLVRLALMFAAPAVIAMLLSELGLAIVSLFAPQLQVFFLAMPIKSGVAIFILLIYLASLGDLMATQAGMVQNILPELKGLMR